MYFFVFFSDDDKYTYRVCDLIIFSFPATKVISLVPKCFFVLLFFTFVCNLYIQFSHPYAHSHGQKTIFLISALREKKNPHTQSHTQSKGLLRNIISSLFLPPSLG